MQMHGVRVSYFYPPGYGLHLLRRAARTSWKDGAIFARYQGLDFQLIAEPTTWRYQDQTALHTQEG